ncbi:MAG TPA: M13 family metallopeptidase [Thermoanaerobaculia bacterium]|nr:M13 family metallopeptidase [Thermoanaerobaculia bacterium]
MHSMKVCLVTALASFLGAVPSAMADAEKKAPAANAETPYSVPVLDPAAIDRGADPCVDFYQYTCGGWMKNNPTPEDRASWSRFDQLQRNNLLVLRGILEKAAAGGAGRDANEQKIGDYYASCMDQKAIDARGIAPLKPELDRIAAIQDKTALARQLAHLHLADVAALFGFGAEADFKNSTRVIAGVDQGGMGLPSRDYYLAEDAKSAELRQKYVDYARTLFQLLGDKPEQAAANAQTVMRIETALAKGALSPVERRDPSKVYHLMKVEELQQLAPSFDWQTYFKAIEAPRFTELNVIEPEFFRQLDAQLRAVPLADWRTYLRYWLVNDLAPILPAAFEKAHFDFYDRTLQGVQEMPPRWRSCVEYVDNDLGEALGREYVEVAFGEQARQRMDELITGLTTAMGEDIRGLDWMGAETKKQAQVKLSKFGTKIGHPKSWRDYGKLTVTRGDALGNWLRGNEFESRRQVAKIGTANDRDEWLMTPPTVNAYYHPLQNNINFPAGILQPPFFDAKADDAVNYGAIGGVIGHEITHGFDDQGSQFDADGNLRNWWTDTDRKEFEERTSCLVNQYSGYTAVDDVKVNGQLTLGENTADLGGTRIAYMALQKSLAGKEPQKIDGFTPDQRFFIAWGQAWCENNRPEFARQMALTNPHAPGRYRANGIVSNTPEFHEAFGCKAGQPMVRENVCRVW